MQFLFIALVAFAAAQPQGYDSEIVSSGYGSPTTPSTILQSNYGGYQKSSSDVLAYSSGAPTGYQSTSNSYQQSTPAPAYRAAGFSGYSSNAGSGSQLGYQSGASSYQSTPASLQYSKAAQAGFQTGASAYQSAPALSSYSQNAQFGYQFGGAGSYQPSPQLYSQSGQASYQSSTPAPSYQSTPAAQTYSQGAKSGYQSTSSAYSSKSAAVPSYQSASSSAPAYQQQQASPSPYGQKSRPKPISTPTYQKTGSGYDASKGSGSATVDAYKPASNGYNGGSASADAYKQAASNGFNAFAPGNVAGPVEVIPILSQSNQPNLGDGSYSYRYNFKHFNLV